MMKQDQLVLLPCHNAIGRVVFVSEEKAVIRVEKPNEVYDVIVTPEGLLPHTNVSIAERLLFRENENIFVKNGNNIIIGKIEKIEVIEQNEQATVNIKLQTEKGTTNYSIDKCYKLYSLKKIIDKLCHENDRFIKSNI